ncbi:hypothetical protein BH11BAC4_BH11BAC4_24930 [soil metagenome]
MKIIFTLLILTGINLTAYSQTADFTFASTNGSFCAPSTIKFTQTTTGNPTGYVWIFGNNSGSNSGNPTTVFRTSGTFTVRLIVIYKKYTLQVTKTIVIHPTVVASFEFDRNNLCKPGNINFTANVQGTISTYQWNFGDGSGTISTSSPLISHYFADYRTYPISLKAISTTGCSGESFTSISVKKPEITGTVTPVSGCVPAIAALQAVVTMPAPGNVTSYAWNFGDGIQATTSGRNATHAYNNTGTFTPKVHIVTNEGCRNDFTFEQVAFGIPPTNHIAYPKKLIFCGSESVSFVSKATNANKYLWDFGEGDSTYVTDTVTQHRFKTLGVKTVKVTPLFNDCPGNQISFTVEVIGVIAGYKYSNTCIDKKVFSFTNNSQGNLSTYTWNLGDQSPGPAANNFVHSYPDTGTFTASLFVTDSLTGCADTYTKNIYTANPLLFNPDSSLCRNSNTSFSIPRNYNNPDAVYNWQVIGLPATQGSTVPFGVTANVFGQFNDNFVIIDNGPSYCPDTIHLINDIIVRGPIMDFTAPAELCISKPYNTVNLSRSYIATDVINVWDWEYGITQDKDSVFQPQPYYFPYWGTFSVKLTAVDMNGCVDSLVKTVTAFDIPFLRHIPDLDTLCAGQPDTLIAFNNDPITWSPSNTISCTTCDTIVARPAVTTTYYVKATNRSNCTVTDSIPIFVYSPFTAVAAKVDNYICAQKSIQLEITPGGKVVSWSPVAGLSDTTKPNPVASPKQSTAYTVTLTDSAGCFSSSTNVNVYVKSLPVVDLGANKTYPYNTNFSFTPFYSNNVRSYLWAPADQLSCNTCAVPTAVSNRSQNYTVTVTSDSGCVATDEISIYVECNGASLLLPTAFTPNNDNLNDYFYPITRGIQKIIRFAIYNREGQLVYEAKNFDGNHNRSGWDGRYKGMPQTSAAYVYTIETVCEIGERIDKKGSFMLIR